MDASEQSASRPSQPTITPLGAQRPVGLGVAAVASIAAGLIHAGAIGVHAEHVGLSRLFMAAAVFQIGWGAVALVHPRRWIGLAGFVGSAAVVAGWVVTRVADISWISGLEVRESPAFADSVCAAFGAIAAGGGLVAWLVGDREIRVPRLALTALAASALAVPALASASSHTHAEGGEQHSHGEAVAATADGAVVHAGATDGHAHAEGEQHLSADTTGTDPVSTTDAATAGSVDGHAHHGSAGATDTGTVSGSVAAAENHADHAAAVAPVPYDPTKPIDLGGVPGVTPEQQARAENLVAITVMRLPQWADTATAEAAGFRSIGDGVTGHEHYVNWSFLNDDRVLDPDYPESLVYAIDRASGTKTLVSAMFMLPDGYTLDTVPDIGGALTQWHIHDNLCFAADPADASKLRVVGLTRADGTCAFGAKSENPNPMIHIWITPHPCGPFAALEGVAAGQVKAGETHACDSAHGAH